MKIRQCFLELQLKMPGMFFRHSVLQQKWLHETVSDLPGEHSLCRLWHSAGWNTWVGQII